jgi:hypothetical protein
VKKSYLSGKHINGPELYQQLDMVEILKQEQTNDTNDTGFVQSNFVYGFL